MIDRKMKTQCENKVAQMQHEILECAREHGMKSRKTRELQKKLIKSREGRIWAFLQVITNQGKDTPGVDGVVFTKDDME